MPHPDTTSIRVKALLALLFCSCQFLFYSDAYALPDDSQQAIEIRSNSAVRDDKAGLTIYSGNVDMRQGSMQITADKVTITLSNNEVVKIVAVGKPAFFKQQPEPNQDDIEARANTIEYSMVKELITLEEQASLKQSDGSTLASERIFYDVKAARVEAGSDQGQVITIIQPKTAEKTTAQ